MLGYTQFSWNKLAAQVFTTEYLKHHKGENYMLEFVVEAWLTHIAGMKAQYKWLQHNESTLKYRSVHIVLSLSLHRMSSNESDHEGHKGEVTYYVLEKPWHS
ncbi:hypothetical protein V8B97DRAFT_2022190 [Scleroderma yunnanense]